MMAMLIYGVIACADKLVMLLDYHIEMKFAIVWESKKPPFQVAV